MREFIFIFIAAIILFGFLRRMMFSSFYASFDRFQKDQQKKEEEERKRKASGKVYISKPGSSSGNKGQIEDIDFEEIK